MTKVVTFGETMLQYNASYVGPLKEDGEYLEDSAGAESNVAADLTKLGVPGVETVWVSRLGEDDAGDFILKELAGKTQVFAPRFPGEKTGVSYLNHGENGEPMKTYRRKGSAASRLTFADASPHLKGCDLLHVTGITPGLSETCKTTVLDALHQAASAGIPASFDLNFREQLWEPAAARPVFEEMIELSSFFKMGYDEAETVWSTGWSPERYARHFQGIGDGLVVVTLGSKGAVAYDGDNAVSHGGFEIEVVDPVGAGDAFVAGFLGAVLQRHRPSEFLRLDSASRRPVLEAALEVANVCGALTCTRRGDTAAMPTMAEVREFVETERARLNVGRVADPW